MLRRLTVSFALVAVLVTPALAEASTVTLTDYNLGDLFFSNNAAGGGGPYAATTTGDALGIKSFATFCVEYNEEFWYGGTYNFTLADGAANGGVDGQTSPNFDPLSDATRWLYFQAVSGGYLSMYTAATGLGLSANVGAHFQYAIWYLEQERSAADIGGNSSAGYLLATYAIGNQNWNTLFANGERVYAMNLTDSSGGVSQDQLAYQHTDVPDNSPVPEPATLVLFGSGLLALSLKLRRRAATVP